MYIILFYEVVFMWSIKAGVAHFKTKYLTYAWFEVYKKTHVCGMNALEFQRSSFAILKNEITEAINFP